MQGLPGQVLPKTETETKPRHVQLSSVPLNPMTPIPSQSIAVAVDACFFFLLPSSCRLPPRAPRSGLLRVTVLRISSPSSLVPILQPPLVPRPPCLPCPFRLSPALLGRPRRRP